MAGKLEYSTLLYSDLNKNPATNSSNLAYNLDSIKQSLDNLFNTPYGSRSFQPTYGNTFYYLLGELITEETAQDIYYRAINDVERHEPRVKLDTYNSSVLPVPDQNLYKLTLVFTVSGLGSNDRFSYEIKLKEMNSEERIDNSKQELTQET